MTYEDKLNAIAELAASLNCKVLKNEPLSTHTSFKTGGLCDLFIYPHDSLSLANVYEACKSIDLYTFVLGRGTNVLFSDGGFRGVVICISSDMSDVSVEGDTITACAGASLKKVCTAALNNGLTGLEFAYGIPGTVGGAVYMNAGAYGSEMKNVVTEVTALDKSGKLITFTAGELDMGYRKSAFTDSVYVIISAKFKLSKGDSNAIKAKMDELMARRKDKQPLEYPSAGSTFKRPEGTYAGLVIEQSGLKGYSVGGAQVSEKHANFVINKDNATSSDILNLIDYIKNKVKETTGYQLECEVKLIPEREE